MTHKLYYTKFDQSNLHEIAALLEHIRNETESMLYYISDEAEFDIIKLYDYHVELNNLSDDLYKTKLILSKLIEPYTPAMLMKLADSESGEQS